MSLPSNLSTDDFTVLKLIADYVDKHGVDRKSKALCLAHVALVAVTCSEQFEAHVAQMIDEIKKGHPHMNGMSKGTISGRVDAIKYVLLGALAQSGDVLDGEQLSSFKDQAAKSGSSNSATHYTKACSFAKHCLRKALPAADDNAPKAERVGATSLNEVALLRYVDVTLDVNATMVVKKGNKGMVEMVEIKNTAAACWEQIGIGREFFSSESIARMIPHLLEWGKLGAAMNAGYTGRMPIATPQKSLAQFLPRGIVPSMATPSAAPAPAGAVPATVPAGAVVQPAAASHSEHPAALALAAPTTAQPAAASTAAAAAGAPPSLSGIETTDRLTGAIVPASGAGGIADSPKVTLFAPGLDNTMSANKAPVLPKMAMPDCNTFGDVAMTKASKILSTPTAGGLAPAVKDHGSSTPEIQLEESPEPSAKDLKNAFKELREGQAKLCTGQAKLLSVVQAGNFEAAEERAKYAKGAAEERAKYAKEAAEERAEIAKKAAEERAELMKKLEEEHALLIEAKKNQDAFKTEQEDEHKKTRKVVEEMEHNFELQQRELEENLRAKLFKLKDEMRGEKVKSGQLEDDLNKLERTLKDEVAFLNKLHANTREVVSVTQDQVKEVEAKVQEVQEVKEKIAVKKNEKNAVDKMISNLTQGISDIFSEISKINQFGLSI